MSKEREKGVSEGKRITSKECPPAIKGDTFHIPMLQILLDHLREIPLQGIFAQNNHRCKTFRQQNSNFTKYMERIEKKIDALTRNRKEKKGKEASKSYR